MECCSTNLNIIFEDLEESLDSDDMLFIYSSVQITIPDSEEEVNLLLWGNEELDDDDFADMIEPIECSRIIFSASHGRSGGIGDNIEDMNNASRKTVLTASDWLHARETSGSFRELTGMIEYDFWLITALRGFYPHYNKNAPWVAWKAIGDHPESDFSDLSDLAETNFDDESNGGNGDGIYQINETIKYVKRFDKIFHGHTKSQFEEWGTETYNNAFATEDLLSLSGISGRVNTTQTLSGSFIIGDPRNVDGGPLIIEKGVELTLDNQTKFNVFQSVIGIKPGINNANENTPGGILIANGATITNACTSPWKGIRVCGNSDHQFTYPDHAQAMGKLILDGATIENAEIAVGNYLDFDGYEDYGGIIYANGSIFKNNKTAAKFRPYSNKYPFPNGKEYNYVSSFNNCSFIIDGGYLHDIKFNGTQIYFHGVKGIKIKGCSFSNETGPLSYGRAIQALDAGFVLTGRCVDPDIYPCDYVNSYLTGFKHAIEATNTKEPSKHISIRNSDFENNGVGINLNSVNYAIIVDNNFDLGWTPGCENDAGTGIYLDNSHSFAIENDTFYVANPISGKDYVGIHTNNTNNAGDEIYKNHFDDLVYANYAEGKNWNVLPETGLAYYCNTNSSNTWDFYVHDDDGSGLLGIQLFQGNPNRVAGNAFSANASWHFDNNGAYEISYYYDKYGSGIPDANKLYRVKPEPVQLSKICPNQYGGGNEIKLTAAEYAQKETDYTSALNSYNTAQNAYNNTNDSVYLMQMSHYNMLLSEAAYDIIRSDLNDTIAHDSLFVVWQVNLDTYTTAENMVDYYIQKSDYVTAMNKVDSLPINFTLSTYDSAEYNYYYDFKDMQTTWLDSGRDIFSLTTSEISNLQAIADSSKGTAGAQARGILNFALDTAYFYTNCVAVPDISQKSGSYNVGNEISYPVILQVSPNPANHSITFEFSNSLDFEYGYLKIVNSTGKLIDKLPIQEKLGKVDYNVSTLPSGIYYYNFVAGNVLESGKIIVNH